MKVKLLKKIRKRYEITKVEELGTDPGRNYKWGAENFGLPFYMLWDTTDHYAQPEFFRDGELDVALERLMVWIRHNYAHKVKKMETKTKKAWYNG